MRRLLLALVTLGLLVAPTAAQARIAGHGHHGHGWQKHGDKHGACPEKIALPDGFAPEGLEIPFGTTFFVGSVPTGAIYTGDVCTGTGRILVPGATTPDTDAATGIEYDHGRLWVAGAGRGTAKVYDANSGELLHTYQLGTPPATFINDVVVTRKAAYFTDSQQPVIYSIALGKHGEAADTVTTIPLSGDYVHVDMQFNLNGIVATGHGKHLIAVQSAGKKLFVIDPSSGATKAIDVGTYDLAAGDGLLLKGRTLFVVQNQLNQIAVFRLSKDLLTATLRTVLTDPDLDVPTTIDLAGKRLYAVNARFGTATPQDQHYDIVKVG